MPAPFVIFCSDPLNPRGVDPAFEAEVGPARDAGFTVVRLDHDALDHAIDADAALRSARFDGGGAAIYRGWMMSSEAYAALAQALAQRDVNLITSPLEYAACHHAPGSYSALGAFMPRTAWLPISEMDDLAAVRNVLAGFGPAPLILKDWIKSQASGYWEEACFIRDASDLEGVQRTVSRFRELQADSLTGGLVFKAYVPLTPIGSPADEFRAFIVRGDVGGCWPRSESAATLGEPPSQLLADIAARTPSPFASADLGQDEDGRWWLLEVGDGQVSGLPDPDAARSIFSALAA